VVLIEYKLKDPIKNNIETKTAENKLDKFIKPLLENPYVGVWKYLFVENKSIYHGKEIDGFKGKIVTQDLKLNKSYNCICIFKRPKHERIDLEIKIKTQLVAKELAIHYSKFIFIFQAISTRKIILKKLNKKN
jgi:hypothetical protein